MVFASVVHARKGQPFAYSFLRTFTMTGTLRHLLVATDGSASANRAVSFAITLARRDGGELLICSVVDHAVSIVLPLIQSLDDAAYAILAEAATRATDAGVAATTELLDGRPAHAIVKLARERSVDAIVLGTRGKRVLDRVLMGSTADGVLRRSNLPTFVVPPGMGDAEPTFARILVAIDDSDPSDAGAAFARDFAKAQSALLLYCGVAETGDLFDKASTYGYDPTSMLEELRATTSALVAEHVYLARANQIATEIVIADGDPAEQILKFAISRNVGLIVMGTHGRRGLRRLIVGSVAESVVRQSTVPVVVVRAARLRVAETERESALATSAKCYT